MIDQTVTLVDNGLFTELAVRLARDFKRVRSNVGWEDEFPTINDRAVGSGLGEVEWVEDPYVNEVVDSTDIYLFPDIFHAGDQQLLERVGKRVWGSKTGDEFETKRVWFRGLQQELRMPVPESKVIKGWNALTEFLKDHGHCFIKTTSKIRGSMETKEFFDYEQAEYWLWNLKLRLGCAAESILFLVEEPIETPFETGVDTYCVRGKIPKTPLQGIEVKGKLILCSAQLRSATPKPIDDALDVLSPFLAERAYCNFLSAEFRGDILTDICARAPNPGLGVEMEMIRNLGDIIVAGVQGELVEPDYEFTYGIQAAIFHNDDKDLWKQFRLPEDIRRWVKLMEFCKHGELYQIIPRPPAGEKIGWLLGVGNTIKEAAAHLFKNAESLKNYPFEIKSDSLEEAISQAHEMKLAGFEFADEPLPEPEEVTADE